MGIVIEDRTDLSRLTEDMKREADKAILKAAEYLKDEIQKNADSSVDAYGNGFARYNKKYLARRAAGKAKGTTGKEFYGGPAVNLQLSGNMLGSIDTRVIRQTSNPTAELFFNDSFANKVATNLNKDRKFFALSPRYNQLVLDWFADEYQPFNTRRR